MASVLLHLGILFTIAVPIISAQGPINNDPSASNDVINDVFDLGLKLVPGLSQIVVQKKTPVLLNCSIVISDSTLQPLSFSWLKDGKVIDPDRPRSRAQLFRNGSLLLRPRRKKSKGRNGRKLDGLYSCNVSTARGSFIARRVEVVVAGIDRNFTKEPVSQEVQEGGVARFECKINAKPHAYYVWNRNDSQLPQDDPRFSFLPSGVMQITNVKPSDAGKYWCQATPHLYSIQEEVTDLRWNPSHEAELKVIKGLIPRPPSIVAAPQNVSVAKGKTVFMECLGDGQPRPLVRWKKGEKIISESHSPNLVIYDVAPEDAGIYNCSISSRGKTVSAAASLSVLVPPKEKEEPLSHVYPLPRSFNIVCKMDGTPKPNISWYHNGKPMEKSGLDYDIIDINSGQRLLFLRSDSQNSGFYQCIANNSAGVAMSLSRIRIIVKDNAPPKPQKVSSTALSSMAVNISWCHDYVGLYYVVYYNIYGTRKTRKNHLCQNIKSKNHQHSCEVKGLVPNTKYSVSVQAFSRDGGSIMSESVEVTTLEDVPIDPPLLEITSPQPYSINVSWTPLLAESRRGIVVNYRIYYREADDENSEISRDFPASQTSYLISGVEPEVKYEILVIAATKVGFMLLDANHMPWVTYTTPSVRGLTSPHFNLFFVNMTAVMIHWRPPNLGVNYEVTGYKLKLLALGHDTNVVKDGLSATAVSHIFSGLDKESNYEVTLTAKTQDGLATPLTREFRMLDLSKELVPTNVRATDLTATEISLTWSPVPGKDIQYEVCFGKEKQLKVCEKRDSNRFKVRHVSPFTRYEFIVRVLQKDWKGDFSKIAIVETKADLPSPPVNLTVALMKKGSVTLSWLPPSQPNGDIDSYLIMYGKRDKNGLGVEWKKITVTVGANTCQIDDLYPEEYKFKLRAHTVAGFGDYTETKSFIPVCNDDLPGCHVDPIPFVTQDPPNTVEKRKASVSTSELVAIIAGIFLIIFLILLAVFCFCRRRCMKNRDHDPSHLSHTSNYPTSNGHIPSVYTHTGNHRPSNGHAYPVLQTPVDNANHEFMPMLQIDEHELPDSKGESDTIIIPNGLRLNGYVKQCYRPPLTILGRLPGDNVEEMHGLMSADSNDVINGTGHTTFMSSLDDIGRGETRTGDHSSEDSGTGSRRAGMLGSSQGIGSPASSPGSSTETNSSLGRRHLPSEVLRWGDEIGGVRIDPATGTVIGVVQPMVLAQSYEDDVLKEEEEEEWVQGCSSRMGSGDENAANDRDSGHGSEAKAYQGLCSNSAECDDYPACTSSTNTDDDYVPVSSAPGDPQLSLPLPPPPPPPPPLPLPSSSSQQLTSNPNSSSSSKNNKFSNKIPLSERPSHRSARTNRFLTSHSDLPPPPPSPPRVVMPAATSHSPLSQDQLAANAGPNLPGVVHSGSTRPQRQSESESEVVAFSSIQKTPPNLPHIA